MATRVGGTPTVVVEGQTGWLVPPEDTTALAAAIVECLGDEQEGLRRARAGHLLVEERFASGPMLDQVERLLNGAVAKTEHRQRAR